MTQRELSAKLELHKMWLNNEEGGERLNMFNANLSGADLSGADLSEAKGVFVFNRPNGRTCCAVVHEKTLMIKAGYFWGTLDEFEAKAKSEYGDNKEQNYHAQIDYLKSLL